MAQTSPADLLQYQNVIRTMLLRQLVFLFDVWNEKSGGAFRFFTSGFTGDFQTRTYLDPIADTVRQRDIESTTILDNHNMTESDRNFPKYHMTTEALSWMPDAFDAQGRPADANAWAAAWVEKQAEYIMLEASKRAVSIAIALAAKNAPSSAPWPVDITLAGDTRLSDYLVSTTRTERYFDQAEQFQTFLTLPIGTQQLRQNYKEKGGALESVAGTAWAGTNFSIDGMGHYQMQHPTLAAGTGAGTMYSLMMKPDVIRFYMRKPPKVLFQTENLSENPLEFARVLYDLDVETPDYSFDKSIGNPDLAQMSAGANYTATFVDDEHVPVLSILSADTARPEA